MVARSLHPAGGMRSVYTNSYWIESTPSPKFSSPKEDLAVDVAVIGGGLTGITTAYLVKRAGLTVALLERNRCLQADTGHTTAHLTCVIDTRLPELVEHLGREHAQATWDAGLAALDCIDRVVRRERVNCQFEWVPAYLFHRETGPSANDPFDLRQEAALAAELGFDAEYVERVPIGEQPGIRFDGQAKFHPQRYLASLLKLIPGKGSYVFENAAVEEMEDDPLTLHLAGGHRVHCGHVVIATHVPLMGTTGFVKAAWLQSKLALYSTYAIAGWVTRGRIPEALFWDTGDPYYYLRVDRRHDHDFVIFGGEDHKTGQADDTTQCYVRLEQRLRIFLPDISITHRWSGQVVETNDGLPYIGENEPGQFIATGFSGNGMTFGTLSAMMATDAVLQRDNPWRELFDAGRTKIRGGTWDYLKENKDYPYYLIRDRFAGAASRPLRSIKRGTGAVIDLDGQPVAAFRNLDGQVTVRSATCTHMGCLVNWNEAERTWDCPCHGSRFRPTGEVIAGPAESPLSDVQARSDEAESAPLHAAARRDDQR